jgi:segregation and condensation protein B
MTGTDAPSLFAAPPMGEQERMVEAILFAAVEPVTVAELESRLPMGCDAAEALAHLRSRYDGRGCGWSRWGTAMRSEPRPIWAT